MEQQHKELTSVREINLRKWHHKKNTMMVQTVNNGTTTPIPAYLKEDMDRSDLVCMWINRVIRLAGVIVTFEYQGQHYQVESIVKYDALWITVRFFDFAKNVCITNVVNYTKFEMFLNIHQIGV